MELLCYLNGSIMPLAEAKIGITDLGLLRGFGIYQGITAFSGEPFHFDDHWERFEKSADALGLALPRSQGEVRHALRTLIARNSPGRRASIRLVLTGGAAKGGLEHVPGRETLFATAEPTAPLAPELYEHGASLITHEYERFMPESKTTHYITAVMLQPKRKEAGALEILFTKNGRVLECATSNVFVVKDGAVYTPGADVLKGVTRAITLALAEKAYPTHEAAVLLPALFGADEAFITSSFKDIVPVVAVDGRIIGGGKPGPVTRDLMKRFTAYAHAH
ncbi:MAG TPA: aminotransferase class IV [Candidatus Paceibacterota bacterium]|nr:aminotransferase class IV [Candidatus Paceibacterota bacterium]